MTRPSSRQPADGPDRVSHRSDGSVPESVGSGESTPPDRQLDGAWRVWERLRAVDLRYAVYVDLALALGFFAVCAAWVVRSSAPLSDLWLVGGLTLPLVLRRRAPVTVFMTLSAVAFAQWLLGRFVPADAALLLAMYTVASLSRWLWVAACGAVLELGVVMATVKWKPTGNDLKSLVFLTGLAFTALLAGIVVRAVRSQLVWLAERTERLERERDQQASLAAAAERARIAREMHDVVSHNIQVMVTLADAASATRAADPTRAAEAMEDVSSTGRLALSDMRRMLGVLRDDQAMAARSESRDRSARAGSAVGQPAGAEAAGRPDAVGGPAATSPRAPLGPQPGLSDLDALVERVRGTGLPVTVTRSGQAFDLSAAAGLTVYRIVQEALTNVLKHADEPASVEVSLVFEEPDVVVRVSDDGRVRQLVPGRERPVNGHVHGQTNGSGQGVTGMTERAAAFGGSLHAGPRENGGWSVMATLRGCRAPDGA